MIGATLFSGIGAPETAMPSWSWPWHAEIEKFPSAVLRERHPHSTNLGDVGAHDVADRAAAIGRPNVLIFGSPCQSFSIAGKRLGLDDPRGNLALVALGLAGRLLPEWIVFENVPGLLSSDRGRDFASFLGLLGKLGYGFCGRVLDAQYFGVPQRRRRVFVVGHLGDWRRAAAVLLEPESLRGDSAPRRETGEGIAGTIGASLERCSADDGDRGTVVPTLEAAAGRSRGAGTPLGMIAPAVAHGLNAGGGRRFDAQGETMVAFGCKDYGADAGPLAPTLRAMGHTGSHANAGGQVAIAFGIRSDAARSGAAKTPSPDAEGRVRKRDAGFNVCEEFAPTLDASGAHTVAQACAVRRLTPRECERLQGFPDDYTLIRYRNKSAADGPRYKALGNSMAVPVMRWILSRIDLFERDVRPQLDKVTA